MDIVKDAISRLESAETFGYHRASANATEPVALSAIALMAARRESRALPLLHWLVERQAGDGSLGINAVQQTPGWPTAWAIIAWRLAQSGRLADPSFELAGRRAVGWLLAVQGEQIERTGPTGHNTMIPGWPWVQGTHAWAEPTAMSLLALRHAGRNDHPRAQHAVRLLRDRILPHGGCNYGNTIVFGQELRPHVQPTGLCLLALAGEPDTNGRAGKSIDYLLDTLPETTAAASLSYGLLGLAAWDRLPAAASSWVAAAAGHTLARDPAPYKLALLTLAALGPSCPLIPSIHETLAT
jgi:hypothetical protein